MYSNICACSYSVGWSWLAVVASQPLLVMITAQSMFCVYDGRVRGRCAAALYALLPRRAVQASVVAGCGTKAIAASRAATPELLYLLQPGGKVPETARGPLPFAGRALCLRDLASA